MDTKTVEKKQIDMFPIHPLAEMLFWDRVCIKGKKSCWRWMGATTSRGYGAMWIAAGGKKATHYAHRLSYRLSCGPIPKGLYVCHHCDNKWCVNPSHLFLGTAKDNVSDMIKKGRDCRHERHGMAKLDWKKVSEIRKNHIFGSKRGGGCSSQLAKRYGVTKSTIVKIFRNKTWVIPKGCK